MIDLDGERLSFEKASFWSRAFQVRRGTETIGSIERQGPFTRRCEIDLPRDWPLPIRVFLFWMAVLLWNRESAAAAV